SLLRTHSNKSIEEDIYITHVEDPWTFYCQLERCADLNSISESLNNGTQAKSPCGQLFQAGDLISAVYSEDSLWYRAVVKEKTSDNLLSIQYIDYGNTSVINVDQAHRLPEDFSISFCAVSLMVNTCNESCYYVLVRNQGSVYLFSLVD
uniref:Tudor domain containing 6 n=1 Tax=Calidris pygmaea TaxID=425635 RepID=A0A8C3JIB3_9CHAR